MTTLSTELRVAESTIRTRRVLTHTRIATVLPDDAVLSTRKMSLSRMVRAHSVGPVAHFLQLEANRPFILETAHRDFQDPSQIVVVRTPINRLYIMHGQLDAVSVVFPDTDTGTDPINVSAIFG